MGVTNTGKEKRKTGRRHKPKKDITKKKLKQQKINFDHIPSMQGGVTTDHGTGDLPVQLDETSTLRLISKKTRGLNMTEGKDHKINTGIEYLKDMQTGIFVA